MWDASEQLRLPPEVFKIYEKSEQMLKTASTQKSYALLYQQAKRKVPCTQWEF